MWQNIFGLISHYVASPPWIGDMVSILEKLIHQPETASPFFFYLQISSNVPAPNKVEIINYLELDRNPLTIGLELHWTSTEINKTSKEAMVNHTWHETVCWWEMRGRWYYTSILPMKAIGSTVLGTPHKSISSRSLRHLFTISVCCSSGDDMLYFDEVGSPIIETNSTQKWQIKIFPYPRRWNTRNC